MESINYSSFLSLKWSQRLIQSKKSVINTYGEGVGFRPVQGYIRQTITFIYFFQKKKNVKRYVFFG